MMIGTNRKTLMPNRPKNLDYIIPTVMFGGQMPVAVNVVQPTRHAPQNLSSILGK